MNIDSWYTRVIFLSLWGMWHAQPYIWFNSLAPGNFEWNFRYLIFQIISVIDGWGISCELALRWMSLDLTDDKSTLVQVMAWCRQATSHYLSQCWPRSLSPYGVTRLQWVNWLETAKTITHTTTWFIILIVEFIKMHVAKFREEILSGCWAAKV